MPSFDNKKGLRYVITLSVGSFGSTQSNKVIIQGFRSTCEVTLAGENMMGLASIKIFGVAQEVMNACTYLSWNLTQPRPNEIQVYAIDGTEETLVFSGNIVNSWGDYQAVPDVGLYIQARSAMTYSLQSTPPRSFKSGTDVASICGIIARSMGKTLENNGVQSKLDDEYLSGSPVDQLKDLANHARIDWGIEGNIVWIAPKGQGRGGLIPLISRETGMVGYPTFDANGVNVRMLYNANIRQAGKIKIETDIQRASGEFVVQSFGHTLSSEMPDGPWFTNVRANYGVLTLAK